ncbi:MAG TPA: hypothetical protein PKJ47_13490 [Candidatus Limiplasma sp.]|nr:hypothetical protein [Candidatus Limiplasma sp.]
MRYTPDNWLELFDVEGMAHEDWPPPRAIRPEGTVLGYRTKTIRAGEQIEVMSYPIWSTAPELPDGAPVKKSAVAIARANAENARKHFERKMNTNFCDRDYRIDLTYTDDFLPDAAQARLDVQNYLRRVKYACRKAGLPQPRYMGVSEGKREGSRQKRVHHHIVISCGLPREELESIWKKGRVRTDRLQADRFGYTALARYLMKEPEGAKRYFCSRNLKEPTITVSDTKLSIRKAERIAQAAEESAPAIFERLYPGCEFLDCQVRHSDFVAGVYISVRLRKRETNNERRDKPCSGGGKARSAGQSRTIGKGSTRSRCGSSAGGSGGTGRST